MPEIDAKTIKTLGAGGGVGSTLVVIVWLIMGQSSPDMLATHQQVLAQHGDEFVDVRRRLTDVSDQLAKLKTELARFKAAGERFTRGDGRVVQRQIDQQLVRIEAVERDVRAIKTTVIRYFADANGKPGAGPYGP